MSLTGKADGSEQEFAWPQFSSFKMAALLKLLKIYTVHLIIRSTWPSSSSTFRGREGSRWRRKAQLERLARPASGSVLMCLLKFGFFIKYLLHSKG